jgi:acyl-CoA reductase-like NAD-dependent aldehyde dehydrogenase
MAQEEIFGPVLSVFKYDDLNDAVEKSNDSDFGLASYVWSNDIREAHDLAHRIESGNVFINSYGYQSEIPFGGYKKSGVGREHGSEAMLEYTQSKSITVGMGRFQSRFNLN